MSNDDIEYMDFGYADIKLSKVPCPNCREHLVGNYAFVKPISGDCGFCNNSGEIYYIGDSSHVIDALNKYREMERIIERKKAEEYWYQNYSKSYKQEEEIGIEQIVPLISMYKRIIKYLKPGFNKVITKLFKENKL